MHRRDFLAGTGAVTLAATTAGCTAFVDGFLNGGSSRSHELVDPENWTDRDTSTTETGQEFTGSVEIESGYYAVKTFEPQAAVQYSCEWETAGNPLDVIFFDEEEYDDRFRDGKEIQFDASLSEKDTTGGSVSDAVQAGDYVVVFSNSEQLGTKPEGTVNLDVTLAADIA